MTTNILNVSIGGFTTMRLELLKSASREGGSLIPRHWTSNKAYAELVSEGLVTEEPETNQLMRRWKITEAGRTVLSDRPWPSCGCTSPAECPTCTPRVSSEESRG